MKFGANSGVLGANLVESWDKSGGIGGWGGAHVGRAPAGVCPDGACPGRGSSRGGGGCRRRRPWRTPSSPAWGPASAACLTVSGRGHGVGGATGRGAGPTGGWMGAGRGAWVGAWLRELREGRALGGAGLHGAEGGWGYGVGGACGAGGYVGSGQGRGQGVGGWGLGGGGALQGEVWESWDVGWACGVKSGRGGAIAVGGACSGQSLGGVELVGGAGGWDERERLGGAWGRDFTVGGAGALPVQAVLWGRGFPALAPPPDARPRPPAATSIFALKEIQLQKEAGLRAAPLPPPGEIPPPALTPPTPGPPKPCRHPSKPQEHPPPRPEDLTPRDSLELGTPHPGDTLSWRTPTDWGNPETKEPPHPRDTPAPWGHPPASGTLTPGAP